MIRESILCRSFANGVCLKGVDSPDSHEDEFGQAAGVASGSADAGNNAAAKPKAKLTTPSSAAIKALKKLNVKKLAIFTPYRKKLNDQIINHFSEEKFDVVSNSYLDIAADYDIGKVDQDFLLKILSNMNIADADALFISCTALPVLNIIEKLEKKINKPVLSSNQTLIWNTLEEIGKNTDIKGFGKLFLKN